jgi:hypothetical protein
MPDRPETFTTSSAAGPRKAAAQKRQTRERGGGDPDSADWTRDLRSSFGLVSITSLARSILERAASLDRSEEGRVTTTRLFIAIVEARAAAASEPDGIAVEAVGKVLASEGRFGRAERIKSEYLAGTQSSAKEVRSVETSNNVAAILKAAASEPISGLGQEGVLSADGLVVALLCRHVTKFEERLDVQDIALPELRAAVLNEVQRLDPSRAAVWREAFGTGDTGPQATAELPGFASDRVEAGTVNGDPLDLLSDVRAFARLICLEEAQPPLSIGLFGGWGAGKSTFMQLLEREIDGLTGKTRRAAKAPSTPASEAAGQTGPYFIRNVVQVRFNAWQFADANLWASLTAEFFDQLRAGGFARSGRAIHTRLVERVNAHVHTLTSEAATTREALASSEAALRSAQKVRDKAVADAESASGQAFRQTVVDAVTRSLDAHKNDLEEMGRLTHQDDPAKDIEAFLQLAKQLQSSRGQLHALFDFIRRRGWRATLAVAGVTAVGLGLWLMWPKDVATGAFRFDAFNVFACLAGVAAFLRSVLPGVRMIGSLIDSTASFAASLDGQLEQEITKVAQAEETLQRAAKEAEARRAAAERASKALARYIDPSSSVANPPRLLRYMLEDDPDTRALEKEIGLISRVRRLFQAVDEIVLEEKQKDEHSPNAEERRDPDVPDRIVIYIDDLDRCTPAQVYAVLQAIHLLLAFRLFVVVVGVDVGWIQEALAHELRPTVKDSLSNRADTEIDERKLAIRYLQKIFQLPFWLRPLSYVGSDGGSYARYIRALLARNLEAERPGPLGSGASAGSRGQGDTAEPVLESAANGSDAGDAEGRVADDSGLGEALATVRLIRAEVDFLASDTIAKLAGGEPRSVKRLVNIYRLVRSRVVDVDRTSFLGEQGRPPEYPIAAILIAVETGQSLEVADAFYDKLTNSTATTVDTSGVDAKIVSALEHARQLRGGVQVNRKDYERWARTARRYSFNRYVLDSAAPATADSKA